MGYLASAKRFFGFCICVLCSFGFCENRLEFSVVAYVRSGDCLSFRIARQEKSRDAPFRFFLQLPLCFSVCASRGIKLALEGLPVIKSLEIIAQSLSSQLYSLKTWEVISRVKNGEKISGALMDTPFLFPETVTQMLAVGEQTASMGKISEKVAEHYDREIDHSLKRLMSLFEPIMIVLVGVTVAMLALAILTPVFKLTTLV
jgi:type II secretory pathway component PulF